MPTPATDTPATPRRKPAYGSYGAMLDPRAPDDFYRSPTHAMALLMDTIAPARLAPTHGLIIDAGAGDGRLTEPLFAAGYRVIGIELQERDPEHLHPPYLDIRTGKDFLSIAPADIGPVAAVVMNPPFKIAAEFIRHGLTLIPDGGEVHALLRHAWMNAASHADLLPMLHRVVMCRRLKMIPAINGVDKGHSGSVDFSWFSFRKGDNSTATDLLHAKQSPT